MLEEPNSYWGIFGVICGEYCGLAFLLGWIMFFIGYYLVVLFVQIMYWLSLPFTYIPMIFVTAIWTECPTDKNPFFLDYFWNALLGPLICTLRIDLDGN